MSVEVKDKGNHKTVKVQSQKKVDYFNLIEISVCHLWMGQLGKLKSFPDGRFYRLYQLKTVGRGYINFTIMGSKEELLALKENDRLKMKVQVVQKRITTNGNEHDSLVVWGTVISQNQKLTGSVKFLKNARKIDEDLLQSGWENPQGGFTLATRF